MPGAMISDSESDMASQTHDHKVDIHPMPEDVTSDVDSQVETENIAEAVSAAPTAADVEALDATRAPTGADEIEYPPMKKVYVVASALFLAMFLVALDRTIIATAIPKMTDEFDSFDDIGWYGSAYLLTMCCFQLLWGRVYTFWNPKTIFLSNVVVFEIGSAVCGAAPSSTVFIVGRAIAGIGSAGVMSGVIVVIIHLVPLAKRPMFQALFGVVFGIASVVGPLLGGAFTDSRASWRWCFYINLPIGAVAFVVLILLLNINQKKQEKATFRQNMAKMDLLGSFFFIPAVICFLLALQWGGGQYSWSNWRIILLFVLAGVLGSIFVALQILRPDIATVAPRIIKQRSILAGVWYSVCTGSSMMLIVYYSPIWLQAIKGESALESGITMIPMLMTLVVAAAMSGAVVQRSGYYVPSMLACSILMAIGTGLFITLKETTSRGAFIGFEILFGFGLGLGMQQPGLAAQAVVAHKDAPTAISLMFFGQTLGGAIFLSVGQNVLDNKLISGLSGLTGFDASSITDIGATDLRSLVPAADLGVVLTSYNAALVDVFKVTTALAAVSIVAAAAMEWKSIKKAKRGQSPNEDASAGAGGDAVVTEESAAEKV